MSLYDKILDAQNGNAGDLFSRYPAACVDNVPEGANVLGTLSEKLQKLCVVFVEAWFAVDMELDKQHKKISSIKSMADMPSEEERQEVMGRLVRLTEDSELMSGVFWGAVKDEFGVGKIGGSLGITKDFKVYVEKHEPHACKDCGGDHSQDDMVAALLAKALGSGAFAGSDVAMPKVTLGKASKTDN